MRFASRNVHIAEGQARAWRDSEIRARWTSAIAQAWDDALLRAVMRELKLKLKTARKENR